MIDTFTLVILGYFAFVQGALHFLADFIFQTDEMAKGKSKSNFVLTEHVATYTFIMFLGNVIFMFPHLAEMGLTVREMDLLFAIYILYIFGTHWGTDWITSRINSKLFKQGKTHLFFVSIGLDQLIHYITIMVFPFWVILNI